jgi:hypothetical protein
MGARLADYNIHILEFFLLFDLFFFFLIYFLSHQKIVQESAFDNLSAAIVSQIDYHSENLYRHSAIIVIIIVSVVIEGIDDTAMAKDNLINHAGVKDAFHALIQAYAYDLSIKESAAKSAFADTLGVGTNMARLLRGEQSLTIQHIALVVDNLNSNPRLNNNYALSVWQRLEELVSKVESDFKCLNFALPSRVGNANSVQALTTNLTPEELLKLVERNNNYARLGIVDCTERLENSPFIPERCMEAVRSKLYFMGVRGEKWLDTDIKYDQFEEMLKRLSNSKEAVRFLLINPKSSNWGKLSGLRKGKSYASFFSYRELMDEFPTLKVKLYDALPSFRLQFVNDEYVTVSRYRNEFENREESKHGWGAPHLYIDNEDKKNEIKTPERHLWSLYPAFQTLYEYFWKRAVELTHELLDSIEKIV